MEEASYLNRSCFPVFLPDTVRDTFLIDPAVILIVVGVVMFFITFCGCIGALRENIRLLKTVIDIIDTNTNTVLCYRSSSSNDIYSKARVLHLKSVSCDSLSLTVF